MERFISNEKLGSIEGKVVVVTGSGSGIGRAIARRFAENGAKVVVSDLNEENGQATVDMIKSDGYEASFVKCDVSCDEQIKHMIDYAVEHYGKLNVMVNNAGFGYPSHPLHDWTAEDFDKIQNVLFKGVFLGTKYAVEAMIDTDSRDCSIINISSASAFVPTEGAAFYGSCKSAVNGLTRVAALDYAKHDITVNAILPSLIKTEVFNKVPPERMAVYNAMGPMGIMAPPAVIADAALFLASDMARYISGALIPVDGAFTAGNMMPATVWNKEDTRVLE